MKNLRKAARGKPCMVRAEGCSYDPETTILAHVRRANIGGVGLKPPDICGVWACSNCHDRIDGRAGQKISDTELLEALLRTLAALHAEGLV